MKKESLKQSYLQKHNIGKFGIKMCGNALATRCYTLNCNWHIRTLFYLWWTEG